MKTSETIKEIATAICKMQAAMKPADKDGRNPAFKSKYSDINSVWEALRLPLTANGLSVWQDVTTSPDGVSVTTRVVHTSGEWIEFGPFYLPLGAKKDAQGYGSCVTYGKRYSLCAALGITSSDEDDDGNAACAAKHVEEMKASEALRILAEFGEDAIHVLSFLEDRCKRFKTKLADEVEMFKAQKDLAMVEFQMWKDKNTLKK